MNVHMFSASARAGVARRGDGICEPHYTFAIGDLRPLETHSKKTPRAPPEGSQPASRAGGGFEGKLGYCQIFESRRQAVGRGKRPCCSPGRRGSGLPKGCGSTAGGCAPWKTPSFFATELAVSAAQDRPKDLLSPVKPAHRQPHDFLIDIREDGSAERESSNSPRPLAVIGSNSENRFIFGGAASGRATVSIWMQTRRRSASPSSSAVGSRPRRPARSDRTINAVRFVHLSGADQNTLRSRSL